MNGGCPVCRAQNTSHEFSKGGFRINSCPSCLFYFVDNPISPEELKGVYNSPGYFSSGRGYKDYFNNVEGLSGVYQKRIDLMEKYARGRRMLDVGCASGFFLHLAEGRKWEVNGLDISEEAAAAGRKKYGLDIKCGDFMSVSFGEKMFDAAVLNDVLEHIPAPKDALVKLKRHLAAGAVVLISLPNAGSLSFRMLGSGWVQVKPEYHLFYFNYASLEKLMKSAGYRILSSYSEGLPARAEKFLNGIQAGNPYSGFLAGIAAKLSRSASALNLLENLVVLGESI